MIVKITKIFKGANCKLKNSNFLCIKGILADDAESLVGRVQGALYNEFPGTKFLVACTDLPPPIDAKDGAVQKAAGTLPKMQFMSSGDAYCTVQAQNVYTIIYNTYIQTKHKTYIP